MTDRARASWHARANGVVVAYLLLTLVAVLAHDHLPVPRWLAVHLLLLGAATNAIVTWSEHFSVALFRAPAPSRRRSAVRLGALNVGIVGVLVGVGAAVPAVTAGSAVLLAAVVVGHMLMLRRLADGALSGRFVGTAHFYGAAGAALLAGIVLGAVLAVGSLDPQRQAAVQAAHVHANLFGWVGFAVLGTLFTLWPTVLRTRMVDGVMVSARRSLLLGGTGLTGTVAGLGLGLRVPAVVGLAVYAAGVAESLRPFVRTWRTRAPHDAASWSLAASVGWLFGAVVADLVMLSSAGDLVDYLPALDALVPVLATGFVAQVLIGALTYLLPVVLGGGPAGSRAMAARLGKAWRTRVLLINVGTALLVVPEPSGWAHTIGWALVTVTGGTFVLLAASAILSSSLSVSRPTRRAL